MNTTIDRVKQRLDKRVIRPLISPLYVDCNPDYRASVFLAGTEKSGTTWISDIINYRREYRYIFEPFWADRVDICQRFKPRQYIRPDDDNPAFLQSAQTILSGRIRNSWTDRYHRRFIADQRLIKDIRANLFIKWIHCQFPQVPIILLLRHPCAVVRSHLRRTHLRPDLRPFLVQNELVEDHLAPFVDAIEAARDDYEKYIFRWCIETYVPLRQFTKGEIHLAFYEDFCTSPESEIDRLFAFLNKPYGKDVYKQVRQPSPVARSVSAIVSGGSLIDGWRKQITEEQISRAMEILGLFGLDAVYTKESMPNVSGAYEFMEKEAAS